MKGDVKSIKQTPVDFILDKKNYPSRFRIYFQQIICCCCRLKTWKTQTKNNSPQGILLERHSHSDTIQGRSRLCQYISFI